MTTFPSGGPVIMTEDEYRVGMHDYAGICLSCGEVTDSGVEPDAEGYHCEACGERAVMGFEMALVAGHIEFKEESLEGTEALEGGLS